MTRAQMDLKWAEKVCRGDREAMDFLANWWSPYVHEIDDLVDEPVSGHQVDAERVLAVFARAIVLYSHPFYLKNLMALRQVALNVTNAYADSVEFERSGVPWQQQWADHWRHVGAEMVLAVAGICGGYEHMRTVSMEQRVMCHVDHHNAKGKAV